MDKRVCRNAGDDRNHARRPAPYGGPRSPKCATCARGDRTRTRVQAADARVRLRFSLSPQEYAAILAAQGGVCALCRRARGDTRRKGGRRLAVDHDHACCAGRTSCGRCVRGLLCAPCNAVVAHFRDDPAAFDRGAAYLRHPPAPAALLGLD